MTPNKEQSDHVKEVVSRNWQAIWPLIVDGTIREWELIRPVDPIIAKQAEEIAILKNEKQALRLERDQWKEGAANLEVELNRVNAEIKKEVDIRISSNFEEWERNIDAVIKIWKQNILAPKLFFRAPPRGWEWHNPDELTPEQVEVGEGWRLALGGEHIAIGDVQYLSSATGWRNSKNDFPAPLFTYRTRNPLPAPK